MANLETRIAALETVSPPDDLTIIRHYVSPGHLDDEIFCLCDDDGNQWTRQPKRDRAGIERPGDNGSEAKRVGRCNSHSGRCGGAPC